MATREMIFVASGAGGETYWINSLDVGGDEFAACTGFVDSGGNVYIAGPDSSSANNCFLAKYTSSGTYTYSYSYRGAYGAENWGACAMSPAGDVFLCGGVQYNSALYWGGLISKFSASGLATGTTEFNYRFDAGPLVYTTIINDIAYSADGNLFTVWYANGIGVIAKYAPDGTYLWEKTLRNLASGQNGVSTDPSSNVYSVGYTSTNNVVVKYNTAGTLQWRKNCAFTGTSVAATASGAYCFGNSGTLAVLLMKVDTAGNIVWQRQLASTGTSYILARRCVVDSSENIYVLFYYSTKTYLQAGNPLAGYQCLIAKYDSSGALQWQRSLSGLLGLDVKISSDGKTMYIFGNRGTYPGPYARIAKLPTDGTKTGTYGGYTYAAATLTASTPTTTLSNNSNTLGTRADTAGVVTFTKNDTYLYGYTLTPVP